MTSSSVSTVLSFYRGDSEKVLLYVEDISLGDRFREMTTGDFDGDGFPDVVVLIPRLEQISFHRGGPDGLGPGETVPSGEDPRSMVSGDFDGDGFLDLVVTNRTADQVSVIRGHLGGLRRVHDENGDVLDGSDVLNVGRHPIALLSADFTRDGFADVVVANTGSLDLTLLRQRYFSPHRNERIDPLEFVEEAPPAIIDRRAPPRFELELPPRPFESLKQVAIILTTVFELPQGDAFKNGKYYTVVTQPVRILRDSTTIDGEARLTLLLREFVGDLAAEVNEHPERLRVFRKDVETSKGVNQQADPAAIELVPLEKGTGIRFPITRFGSYLVVLERER